MMTNVNDTVIYTGVTSNLIKRVYQHKTNFYIDSFTHKYKLHKLVYYEVFHRIEDAIAREKQIKSGSRKKKEVLINSMNPKWKDIYEELVDG